MGARGRIPRRHRSRIRILAVAYLRLAERFIDMVKNPVFC